MLSARLAVLTAVVLTLTIAATVLVRGDDEIRTLRLPDPPAAPA